jgi:hypothetical protein
MFVENVNNMKTLNMTLASQDLWNLKNVDWKCGHCNFLSAQVLAKLGVE